MNYNPELHSLRANRQGKLHHIHQFPLGAKNQTHQQGNRPDVFCMHVNVSFNQRQKFPGSPKTGDKPRSEEITLASSISSGTSVWDCHEWTQLSQSNISTKAGPPVDLIS